MADNKQIDERVLQLLLEQEQITRAQADRVRALLKRNTPLAEALQKVPLVDPVKFASAQALAAKEPAATPQELASAPTLGAVEDEDLDLELDLVDDVEPVETGSGPFKIRNHGPVGGKKISDEEKQSLKEFFEPAPSSSDIPKITDVADEDFVATWPAKKIAAALPDDFDMDLDDIDDTDESLSPKLPPASGEKFGEEVSSILEEAFDVQISLPGDKGKKTAEKKPAAPAAAGPVGRLPALGDKEAYQTRNANSKPVNLADDEGINLIREVNAIFTRAIDGKCKGFILAATAAEENLKLFDEAGRLSDQETIEQAQAEKILNRIKVMARIETWRRDAQQLGSVRLLNEGLTYRAFVNAEADAKGVESVIVHLEAE